MIIIPDFLKDKFFTGTLGGNTGTGITATVGNASTAAFVYTSSDVSTNVADCTTGAGTITNPGAWTDIVDYDIGVPFEVYIYGQTNYNYPVIAAVDSAEDADDAIRFQVIIDDVTQSDRTATKSGADVTAICYLPIVASQGAFGVFRARCKSSFKVRATRNGTFANADTKIFVGMSHYITYS